MAECKVIGSGEAARLLRRSPQMLRNYVRMGTLPALRLGGSGHFVLFEQDVLELAEKLKVFAKESACNQPRKKN